MKPGTVQRPHWGRVPSVVMMILSLLWANLADAAPINGSVAAGGAGITQSGTTTTINQTTQNVVINWQSFNTTSQEAVHFVQPNSDAAALNRINSGLPTQFLGSLTANGRVFIVNPAGVFFGTSSRIDVGSILATTANISNSDFMNGHYHFVQTPGNFTTVINNGEIKAQGLVALVAPGVENNGVIRANLGRVVLASGMEYTLDFYGDQLIEFATNSQVTQSPLNNAVSNNGSIYADGGQVLLTANMAANVVENVIDMRGFIEAKTASIDKQGSIILSGGAEGIVNVSGKIKSNTVKVLGNKVALTDNAQIDAPNGEVLIGDKNTSAVYMSLTAVINAENGKVILWSNDYTGFYGAINASGGFVETSSANNLQAFGLVKAAQWLLDPRNVSIVAATAGGAFSGGNPDIFTPTANSATVDAGAINATLNLGTSVTITTGTTGTQAGNITVTDAISKTAGGNAVLTLTAAGTITVNNTISAVVGLLDVIFSAGNAVAVNSAITTNGGNFSSTSSNGVTLASTINSSSGTVIFDVNTDGAGANNFAMNAGSSITTTNSGASAVTINVNTAGGGTGTASLLDITIGSGGTLTIATDTGGNVTGGDITQTAGTLLDVGSGSIYLSTATIAGRNIGTAGAPIQTTTANLTLSTGSSGAFVDNTSGVTLGNVTIVSGALTLTTVGNILQSFGSSLIIGGVATLVAGATNDITLNNASNDFATATITSAQDVLLNDSNALILGTSTISGILDVVVSGALTDSGNLIVAGLTTLSAGSANDITLNNANNFSTVKVISGNNVALNDINALIFDASTIGNNLTVTTAGDITQVGALIVSGIATFTAGATHDITLSGANNFNIFRVVSGRDVIVNDINALDFGASTISGTLDATSSGDITDSGNLTVTGVATFAPGAANNIILNNTNNFSTVSITSANNVTLNDTNALILGASTVGGTLDVTTGGAITDSGDLHITGLATFTTTNDDITLNNLNDFSSVDITNANDVTLNDINALNLAGIIATGALNITTAGAMTQSGVLTISGTTSLTAGAANNITLDNSANNFGNVNIVSGNNVTLADVNGLAFAGGASTISGDLSVAINGALTDASSITVSGLTTLDVGSANDITLNNANNFSTVKIISGNNVTLNDINALIFDVSTIGNNLTVTTAGDITQVGALIVSGIATFTAGATHDITLSGANNFNIFRVVSGRDVIVNDINALDFGASTISGTLDATSSGDITDSGNLTVTGVATFAPGAANNIILNNTNNFSTVSITSANNVTLNDTNALILGASTVGGTLDVTTGGAITDSGDLHITGLATFTTTNDDITLNNLNDFSSVDITNANDVTLNDINALNLAGIIATGALNITTAGAMTQSGVLTISGTTSLTAGAANNITLDNSANNFGNVNIVSGNNVTLADVNGLAFAGGASTISGDLSVAINGALTDASSITVSGLTTLDVGSANNITLNTAANNFNSIHIISANNVILVDSNALVFGGGVSTINGTLTVTTGGALTQTAALNVIGLATFNASAANTDILLHTQANDFAGGITFGGTLSNIRDVGLRNINGSATLPILSGLTNLRNLTLIFNNAAIALPATTITGNLSITANLISGILNGQNVFLNGTNGITGNVIANLLTLGGQNGSNLTGVLSGYTNISVLKYITLLSDAHGTFFFNGFLVTPGINLQTVGEILSLWWSAQDVVNNNGMNLNFDNNALENSITAVWASQLSSGLVCVSGRDDQSKQQCALL